MTPMHQPSPEVRVSRSQRLRAIGHSVGFVVTTQDPGPVSFRVEGGEVVEVGGWGRAGPVPDIYHNPPADLRCVHTVLVVGDDTEAGMGQLTEEHLRRYGECSLWMAADVAPQPAPDVEGFAGSGLPGGFVNR